uniref:Uncharacterized protein n=1 Tax=Knipowitschia caucasica TaxID=637954 RepID=A0AAV2JCN5_KNICA
MSAHGSLSPRSIMTATSQHSSNSAEGSAPVQRQQSLYTAEVSSQRQAVNTVKKKLTDAGARCTLRFQLNVNYNNKVQVLSTPSEAERFASSLSAHP